MGAVSGPLKMPPCLLSPPGPHHAAVLETLQVRITEFIEELKAKKPSLEAEQRAGRGLLWDRDIDRDAQADYGDARVAQQGYVYQTEVGTAAASRPGARERHHRAGRTRTAATRRRCRSTAWRWRACTASRCSSCRRTCTSRPTRSRCSSRPSKARSICCCT